MTDRQPTYPGRVAITDELTNETRYAVIEMADEPTDDGTPPTKAYLFDNMTEAQYPAGTEYVNLALRLLAKAVCFHGNTVPLTDVHGVPIRIMESQIDGGVKIATGSYVGTGTYGSASPCSLTFSFKPKLIVIVDPLDWYSPLVMIPVDGSTTKSSWFGTATNYSISCTANGNTVSWYCVNSHPVIGGTESASASGQKNASDFTYHYTAIG